MQNSNFDHQTFLLEEGATAVGYLTLSGIESSCLHIDEVAVDTAHRDRKLGSVLMRFAENFARQCGVRELRLNAIADRVSWYEGFGFVRDAGRAVIPLDEERYHPMAKPLLNHMPS
jgi:ribosomal protein S18 acetylase RimI-like enzyme